MLSKVGGRGHDIGPWRALSICSHEVLGAGMWCHPDIVCGSPRPVGFGHCRTSCPNPKQACLYCSWAPARSQLPVLPADLMARCPGVCWLCGLLPCLASHTSVLDARSVSECRGSCTNSYLFPAFFRTWHSGSTEVENKWWHSVYILSDDPVSLLFCHLPQTFPLVACLIQALALTFISPQTAVLGVLGLTASTGEEASLRAVVLAERLSCSSSSNSLWHIPLTQLIDSKCLCV